MKEQLLRAKQSLETEPAPAAASSDAGPAPAAADGAVDKKAQQRAKKADDYHARHKNWVAEFNELTGGECAGGEAGVKWAAVRAWQQKHWQLNNLLADGLVGPKTLEAAKLLQKKNAPKKEGADEKDAAAGEKEHAAGHAEGAEASADKPNLEADVDEQVAPAVDGKGPVAPKKQATLADFDVAATKLDALIAQFHAPQGQGAQKPIAQHYVEGTEDKEAPPALGAMMKTEALKGYAEAAKELGTKWTSLETPLARAQFLLAAVNDAIAAESVPAIKDVRLIKMANPGEFVASQWIMHMNKPIFEATSPESLGEVASQVFHEGRHAEQRFAVARLVAAKAKSVDDVMQGAKVHQDVATKAFEMRAHPMPAAQQKAAEAFKHDTVDNPDHQDIETSSAAITDAANQAAGLFHTLSPEDQAIASARWQDLRQRAITSLESYYHLATERDAYAAQNQLAAANK